MDIRIEPMTREQMHEMYQAFQMDPMIFDDMELFEQVKNYVYNPEKVDMLYDMRMDEEGSHLFAVMLDDKVIVRTSRGIEFGFVAAENKVVPSSEIVPPLRSVERPATTEDIQRYETNKQLEKSAFDV